MRVHFELLHWPNFSSVFSNSSVSSNLLSLPIDLTKEEVLTLPISQLEKSFTIQTHLSKEMTYLTFLTLGIS
jgi:hypothetical protein